MDHIMTTNSQPPGKETNETDVLQIAELSNGNEDGDSNIVTRSRGESDSSNIALESMEVVGAHQLYPLGNMIVDDESVQLHFPLLPGEFGVFLGRTTDGSISITNFRLLVIRHTGQTVNVPLGLIDTIECRDMFYLHIYCKDSRIIRCSFSNNDAAMLWFTRVSKAATVPDKLQSAFAFSFHAHSKEEADGDDQSKAALSTDDANIFNFDQEVGRLRFDLGVSWRISYLNEEHKLCGTYPSKHIVPQSIKDSEISQAMEYRSLNRFPSVVWRSASTGAVIARSGQPLVGLLGWRNTADENLIEAISQACVSSPGFSNAEEAGSQATPVPPPKLLIVDARNYASALANRGRGGGTECVEYYSNAEVTFMNMPNIHHIRKSLAALRTLVNSSFSESGHNFLQTLDSTGWLRNVALIIKGARTISNAVDCEARPVLVHCSDGWDRTPQLTSLSQLLLDPYYRTIEGFKVMVEREWLVFGHKFADRCGNGPGNGDINERSPVFLQWLDSVYQVQRQFPTAFEFNETFLLKIVLHTYSCLFGTFLCNSENERLACGLKKETSSLWSLLRKTNWRIVNYLYNTSTHSATLHPSYHVRDLVLWSALYCRTSCDPAEGPSAPLSPRSSTSRASSGTASSIHSEEEDKSGLQKTKSCDDICAALEMNIGVRRLSDPNLSSSTTKPTHDALPSDSVEETVEEVSTCDTEVSVNQTSTGQLSASTDTLVAGPGTPAVMESCYEEENQNTLRGTPKFSPGSKTKHMSTSTSELSDSHCGGNLRPVATLRKVDALIAKLGIPEELRNGGSASAESGDSSRSSGTPSTPDVKLVEPVHRPSLDVDGCPLEQDHVQERIRALHLSYEGRLRALERQLTSAKVALYHMSSGRNGSADPEAWLQQAEIAPETCLSGPTSSDSSQPASSEFDAVEEADARFTLWVPDHMATHCTKCQTEFWFVRRRHHCRSCGQVFCRDCSDFLSPVPAQNLFDPVRVCNTCFEYLLPAREAAVVSVLRSTGCAGQEDKSAPGGGGSAVPSLA